MNLDDGNDSVVERLKQQLRLQDFKDRDTLENFVEDFIEKANMTPVEEMGGLSPNQIHQIGMAPFESPAVLQFHPERINPVNTTVITLFRGIADACGDKGLKGTPSGFLPRKLVYAMLIEIAGEGAYWKPGKFWINNEDEFPELIMVRHCATWAGLLRKLHGKFRLTKKGGNLLEEQAYGTIYYELFKQACLKWNWGYMDGYADFHVMRTAFPISLRLLQRHGGKFRDPQDHYGKLFLQAFPAVIGEAEVDPARWESITPEKYARKAYALRMFLRFAIPFGLVDYEPKSPKEWVGNMDRKLRVKKTKLLGSFVEFMA